MFISHAATVRCTHAFAFRAVFFFFLFFYKSDLSLLYQSLIQVCWTQQSVHASDPKIDWLNQFNMIFSHNRCNLCFGLISGPIFSFSAPIIF